MNIHGVTQRNMTANSPSNCCPPLDQFHPKKSIPEMHTNNEHVCPRDLQRDLLDYFSSHVSTIDQCFQTASVIDREGFERLLRSSGLSMSDQDLQQLWESCQTEGNSVSYALFMQRFAPSVLQSKQSQRESGRDEHLPSAQCQILNYATRISSAVRENWEQIKQDFLSLDRHGRLQITIDQALAVMKRFCFPLNYKEHRELTVCFSPKRNGQFHYFDFLQYFTGQPPSSGAEPGVFSRSTYLLRSKQSWSYSPVTINGIFQRIRVQSLSCHESIYRMFTTVDRNRTDHLNKRQFGQLLDRCDIQLDDDELYHVFSEIDRNQDGLVSFDELHQALISDALQI